MLQISHKFPTGNGVVRQIGTREFILDRDLRDSEGDRWYWHLRLRAVEETMLRIHLARPLLIGQFGPAISRVGSSEWLWSSPGPDTEFDIFLPGQAPVGLCATIPYGPQELEEFRHELVAPAVWQVLTSSEAGREIPSLLIPNSEADRLILLTARHHACEAMASYVLEGAVQRFLQMRETGAASRCELYAVPIIDMDGVVRGDQGKARLPWDHNRDYGISSIYRSVGALRKKIEADDREIFSLDLHTPGLRGTIEELPYVVSSGDPGDHETAQAFLAELKSLPDGTDFRSADILLFDQEWNSAFSASRRCCSAWLRSRKNTRIALTIEYPNAVDQEVPVTISRARQFGALLMSSLVAQM